MKDIVAIRHALHQRPGLSGSEEYAHDVVVAELQRLSPTMLFQHVGGYGVVAFWGDAAKPCVAFRADTDALPINEAGSFEYSSVVPNVSHKCGHDGHTAILLLFAAMVADQHLRQVVLVFQPEEETGLGSKKIIESGVLKNFDIRFFFALHNLPSYPLGQVVLLQHTFAAASTGVVYRLKGRQTHASTPEKGLNPGLAVASIIQHFHALSSSPDVPLADFRQSTLIAVRVGDEAFGTSAGYAEVMFTLRAFTNDAMRCLLQEADEIVARQATEYSLSVERELREPFNATENDALVVEKLATVLQANKMDYILNDTPFRWSEDFADYLMMCPGAMFGIGSGTGHAELHHPDYDFPDALIEPAAYMFMLVAKHFTAD